VPAALLSRGASGRQGRRLTAGNGDFAKQQRRDLRDDGVCAVAAHPAGRKDAQGRKKLAGEEGRRGEVEESGATTRHETTRHLAAIEKHNQSKSYCKVTHAPKKKLCTRSNAHLDARRQKQKNKL
jgi:hypothetical protein